MTTDRRRALMPYFPRLQLQWLDREPDRRHRVVDGTLLFLDISGFTAMSERLARLGRQGAEEVADVISDAFTELLSVAYDRGGSNLKFGGDALLLLFDGADHPARAAASALGIRQRLREITPVATSAGKVQLRMTAGLHSGPIDLFLLGGPHRELVVTGPAASRTVTMESSAPTGRIVMSAETAHRLPSHCDGGPLGEGRSLRGPAPDVELEDARAYLPRTDPSSLLPDALVAALVEGADTEHRRAAIAFLGYSGTDGLLMRDARVACDAIDQLVTDVQRAAVRYEVCFLATDIDRDGGKIILTAGVPLRSGGDEERLVLALREVLTVDRPMAVKAGVNRGGVFAGPIGPPYRRTYTVMGDAVNLAARVMSKSDPGGLLATADVLAASRTVFRSTPIPPFSVKGKRRPVEAMAVGDAVGSRSSFDSRALPIVGRDEELEVLTDLAARRDRGSGTVVEITGAAGSGKTRLVDELIGVLGDGADVIESVATPYTRHVPYRGIAPVLRAVLGVPEDDPSALRRVVADRAPDLSEWDALIATAAGLVLDPSPEAARLTEQDRKGRLETAVADLVERVGSGPRIVVFEDSHWMDQASLDLIEVLTHRIATLPWLILVASRSDDPLLPHGDVPTPHIRLGPLSDAAAERLIDTATVDRPLAPHRRTALIERAGGSPLALCEMAHASGSGLDIDAIPRSVEELITVRIDSLPTSERRMLLGMSVLGQRFEEWLVEAATPGAGALLEALPGFITRSDGFITFRDPLAQQVAYEALPYARRRALHALAVELLSEVDEPVPGVLSYHATHAGLHREAWEWSVRAGDQAREIFANVEAAAFYRAALDAGALLEDVDDDERSGIAACLGEVTERAGLFEEAAAAFGTARALTADPVEGARSMLALGRIATREGRFPSALRWFQRGLGAVDEEDSSDAGVVRAGLEVWTAAAREAQGHHAEAADWANRAIGTAGRVDDRRVLAHGSMILDWAETEAGNPDGHRHARRALELYRDLGDVHGQALAHLNLGGYAYFEGDWPGAVVHYEEARALWRHVGNPVGAAMAAANIGETRVGQGRLDEAEVLLTEALTVFRSSGDRSTVAFVSGHLGGIAAVRGRAEEAREHFSRARAGLHDGSHTDLLTLDLREGEALIATGREEEALALVDGAMERARSAGVEGLVMAGLMRVRGRAIGTTGSGAEAETVLRESLALARSQVSVADVAFALDALAELAARTSTALESDLVDEHQRLRVGLDLAEPSVRS